MAKLQKKVYELDEQQVAKEELYDGFYVVMTNLDGNIEEIIKINKQRWEIEENFRIMKTEFEARPVYVRRDDRIKAHFMTCYISLLLYRLLEKKSRKQLYNRADHRVFTLYENDAVKYR